MPRRTTTEFKGFSGFNADVPNPFIRFPGGRALVSDVNDAALALDFGGVTSGNSGGTRGAPRVDALREPPMTYAVTPPSYYRTPTGQSEQYIDPAGFQDQTSTSNAHVETSPIVESGAGRSTTFLADTYNEWLGVEHTGGEPTVETPKSDTRYVFDENAPSLFPEQNEWWKDGALAQGASTSNDGGGIWEGSEQIGDFGVDLALGTDLNASLDSLQFGEDYGDLGTSTTSEFPTESELAFNQPPSPQEFIDDIEWTTSPGDRRFLAGPPEEETPQNVAGTISVGGNSLSDFGGNMSLGNYLNMPLALMNYGGGYPVQGGVVDTSDRGALATGDIQTDPTTGRPFDLDAIPTATGGATYTAPDEGWQANASSGATVNNSVPSGLRVIGHDTRNGAPIYEDEQGNRYVNPGTGIQLVQGTEHMLGNYSYIGQPLHQPLTARTQGGGYNQGYGQSAASAENARQMAMAGANPTMALKFLTPQGDQGRTLFNTSRLNRDRPNITLEGGIIVRQQGGRIMGRGNTAQVGGLG